MEKMTFLVNEIYPCLQGEGNNLGVPSLLIRFQLCNLRCAWCDTPYTHTFQSDPIDPENPSGKQNFQRFSFEKLLEKIYDHKPLKHLILSGGEPTLQNLGLLMEHLLPQGYTAEVETNGTRIPHKQIKGFWESHYSQMQWNISPKFENAGEAIVPDALQHWSDLAKKQENVFFKFVLRQGFASEDLNSVLEIQKEFEIDSSRIWLMPEGVTRESQMEARWLADLCLQHQFRMTPRLHILLYGEQRLT